MPLLSPIEDSEEEVFAQIGEAKRGARRVRLRNLRPAIAQRYEQYRQLVRRLQDLAPCVLSAQRQRDCKHCYDSPTAPSGLLVERIMNLRPVSGSPLCQYCLLGEINSVDHYVPKTTFPEFSVLPRNLLPACARCNELKGTAWLVGNVRKIFNLYYEEIPSARFLYVSVAFLGNRAKIGFDLRKPASISDPLFRKIKRHYEKLDLLERYNVRGVLDVTEWLNSARKSSSNRELVGRRLRSDASSLVELHGRNYWRAILLRNLASNDGFFGTAGINE